LWVVLSGLHHTGPPGSNLRPSLLIISLNPPPPGLLLSLPRDKPQSDSD
jgi:hypothetical protein